MASARAKVRTGVWLLCLVGNVKTGYLLGGQDGAGRVTTFGQRFTKQADAIMTGERRYGRTPKRVTARAA